MPLMNVLAIGIVILSGYLWMLRGTFSAFINLLCVVAAGAVTFAVWEPLGYYFVGAAGQRGFFAEMVQGSAWAWAMVLPFAISLAIFRAALDGVLRRNVHFDPVVNYIGGGLCGALSGIIVSGFAVMCSGLYRLDPEMGIFNYKPVAFDAQGAVKKGEPLWAPTDRWTARFYEHLSKSAFSTSDSLAYWRPDVHLAVGSMRLTSGGGKGRNTVAPKDFSVTKQYTIDPASTGKARLDDMLWDFKAPQPGVFDIDATPFQPTAKLHGYVLTFETGAKEKAGQVIVGNGQVHVVADDNNGTSRIFFPHAILSAVALDPAAVEVPKNSKAPKKVPFARFPFNTGEGKFYPSVGGENKSKFGFEFLIPAEFTPRAIYVKGARKELSGEPDKKYGSSADRLRDIVDLMTGEKFTGFDESLVKEIKFPGGGNADRIIEDPPADFGFNISTQIGFTIQRDNSHGLELADLPRNGSCIRDGEMSLRPEDLKNSFGLPNELKVNTFEVGEGVVVMSFDISPRTAWSIAERGFENDKPIALIDDQGRAYNAIGYVYQDDEIIKVRYTPGTPLTGLLEMGKVPSRTEANQKIRLVFRPTRGAVITGMAIGNKLAIRWTPKFRLNAIQKQ